MVTLLLVLIGVFCITDGFVPSVTPTILNDKFTIRSGIRKGGRRPLLRLWYRRLDDSTYGNATEDIAKARRIPALDELRQIDNTRVRKIKKGIRRNAEVVPFGFDNADNNKDDDSSLNARLQQLVGHPNATTKDALVRELSSLMDGIEQLSQEVDETKSIPPYLSAHSATSREWNEMVTRTTTRNYGDVIRAKDDKNEVKTVQDLRQAILDEGMELREIQLSEEAQLLVNATAEQLLHHDVVELMVQRFKTGSTPGNRAPEDKARLALSIEGGGMRGAVSAGMASAIACLGLCDTFDAVYGSSAGSVIGAYMISRQMCMDVYVDILPAAKQKFVCTKRIVSALAYTAVDMLLNRVYQRGARLRNSNSNNSGISNGKSALLEGEDEDEIASLPVKSRFAARVVPGMNISFVLDGIMDEDHGIRPFDMHAFVRNDQKQQLRVASSYVKNGKLHYKCFGGEHFYGEKPAIREDGSRSGLFACLEPSMTVPGATGPPVRLKSHDSENEYLPYFDAFCFEPLPYRSAVEEGATHVLVLCSRPEGFEPKTKPGVYEQAIAPLYFRSHGLPEVAEYFSKGGQQYIYLEDIMTLEQGKVAGMRKEGPISVPPAKLLYGVEKDHENQVLSSQREKNWNRAHLLPLKVPLGTPELATLEQEQDAVQEAVKAGFAAAFDLLAPAIGLNTHHELTGAEVASLIFPKKPGMLDEIILREKLRVDGHHIEHGAQEPAASEIADEVPDDTPSTRRRRIRLGRDRFVKNSRRVLRILARNKRRTETASDELTGRRVAPSPLKLSLLDEKTDLPDKLTEQQKAEHLLEMLPGFRYGKMSQLAANLKHVASASPTDDETTRAP